MRAEAGLWLRRTLGVGLLLGLWQLAALFFPPLVVPPIPQVAATLAELIREPDFWPTVGTTLLRLVTGLGIGIAAGAVLGLLFGLYPKLEDVGTPLIHVLQSVPPVCWVVLALVWFGFNGRPCIFIVATATVPTVVINLSHGVRGVDRQLLEMARLYRFSRWKTLRHVTLPSIRPYFNSALEIVIGGGWKLAVMGEVLTTNSGIGGAMFALLTTLNGTLSWVTRGLQSASRDGWLPEKLANENKAGVPVVLLMVFFVMGALLVPLSLICIFVFGGKIEQQVK